MEYSFQHQSFSDIELTTKNGFFSCLLIDDGEPVQFNFELVLRKRFPQSKITRLLAKQQRSIEGLKQISWTQFDFVLVSCHELLMQASSWISALTNGTNKPLVMALTKDSSIGMQLLTQGIDVYRELDCSNNDFAACLDELLEVRRYLQAYPLPNTALRALEVIHDSENSVLFRMEDQYTYSSVIKRFKWDVTYLAPHFLDDFLHSIDVLRQLHHPNIVSIKGAHASQQGLYMHMDFVEGMTLKQMIEFGFLPSIQERLNWFRSIVSAVSAMHMMGLVHGDLKASNIMLNEEDQPILLDFGVESQLLHEIGFLAEDEIYGTPYYLSPERIMREFAHDEQADIYALGVLFYELLTGKKPYEGRDLYEVLTKQVIAPIPTLPVALQCYQPLLSTLMAKFPQQRFKSADAILAHLPT